MPFFKLKDFPSRKKHAHSHWVTYPPQNSLYKIKSSRYLSKLKSNKNFVNKLRNDGPWCIGNGDLASAAMMGFHLVCVMYARGSSKKIGIGILSNLNGLSLISFLRPEGFKSINEVKSSSFLIKVRGRYRLSPFSFYHEGNSTCIWSGQRRSAVYVAEHQVCLQSWRVHLKVYLATFFLFILILKNGDFFIWY